MARRRHTGRVLAGPLLFLALTLAGAVAVNRIPAAEPQARDPQRPAGQEPAGDQHDPAAPQEPAASQHDPAAPEEPLDIGLVEEAGVTLMFLDVEVRNARGEPVPGLTAQDFALQLGPSPWEIASVDDLCSQAGASQRALPPPDPEQPVMETADELDPDAARLHATRFIIYLDFSQLQIDGRRLALATSRRFVREQLGPHDELMIAGHATGTGLVELSGFSRDEARLLAALDEAEEREDLFDAFPNQFKNRFYNCWEVCVEPCERNAECPYIRCDKCCVECTSAAFAEFSHGRRSLRALRQFLTRLEGVRGRKVLLLFHQNSVLNPGRFYRYSAREAAFEFGTHEQLLESVGAAANAAGIAVHALQAGPNQMLPFASRGLAGGAVNLSANLADYTGGEYSRSPADLRAVVARVASRRPCTYRIGFEPPSRQRSKVYHAVVHVRHRRLPYSYRVELLTPEDRFRREAIAVLDQPHLGEDLRLTAAIVPRSATDERWEVTVQVALDLAMLPLHPLPGGRPETLDVGGLLYDLDRGRPWEMLGGSQVRRSAAATSPALIHQRRFEALPPGNYRLVAFVRHRELGLYGGAETILSLPAPGEPGLAGPILLRPDQPFFASALPLFSESAPAGKPLTLERGEVPAPAGIPPGGRLRVATWLCPGAGDAGAAAPAAEQVVQYLAREGQPAYRLPAPELQAAGVCARIAGELDTSVLPAGSYSYHLSWRPGPGAAPREGTVTFDLADPGELPPAAAMAVP